MTGRRTERRRWWAMAAATAVLVSACGGSSGGAPRAAPTTSGTPRSAPATGTSTTESPQPPLQDEALQTNDLPSGWADDNNVNQSDGPPPKSECGAPATQYELEGASMSFISVGFVNRSKSLVLTEGLFYDGGTITDEFTKVTDALAKCPGGAVGNGSASYSVTPLALPTFGDQSMAFLEPASDGLVSINADVLIARKGGTLIVLAYGASGSAPAPDLDAFQLVAREAVNAVTH